MRERARFIHLAALGIGIVWATQAGAFPDTARETKAACLSCHANPAGGPGLNPTGTAWKTAKTAFDAAAVKGADYAGSTKCKICHMKEYNSWKSTDHAAAMKALVSGPDSTKMKMAAALKVELKGPANEEAACLRCHTTGHALPGGYGSAAADTAKTAALAMVGCESCHGPGSKHIAAAMKDKKANINRQVTAAMCTQCHTPAMSPAFNFEEYKAKGLHQMKTPAAGK